VVSALIWTNCVFAAGEWQHANWQTTLRNDRIEAKFQAGQLYELTDRSSNQRLISIDPKQLPSDVALFGDKVRVDLSTFKVSHQLKKGLVETVYTGTDGTSLTLRWSLGSDGDLILNASAKTPSPIDEFRTFISGCDTKQHALAWVNGYGNCPVANAPWSGAFLGDPLKDGSPISFPHPLVALFQGKSSGFFIEGREERIGPACLMVKGNEDRATLGFVRRLPFTTSEPQMYEIRLRTYDKAWETAVDPYVKWLEEGAGFVALDKLPEKQAWIGKIKTQAYIGVGEYEPLEQLAKQVNPQETYVGRQGEFLRHGFDIMYPDYSLTEDSIKWAKRARELGFHVGMHFNSKSVSVLYPDLIEKFRPGFLVTGKDENGNDTYESIYEGKNKLIRVSAGLKAWREYLIDQIHYAVDAGVDVIYLDEAMSPNGKFIVDGVDGYQGLLMLMKEIQDRYPHVAVQTEQFNTLTAKYGKIALSQMPLGHPLSAYIFRKFVKVVPEGIMYSPTSTMLMDSFDVWGGMLLGAHPTREQSWAEVMRAIHKYKLVADPLMPRMQVTTFAPHPTGGTTAVIAPPKGDEVQKLLGLRGENGVTAYFEKHATKRGLVVYEPGKAGQWFGTRYFGIKTYDGPGLPAYFGYRQEIKDWLIYDGDKLLGLDPDETYWFDTSLKPSPARFHLFKVPDDFVGVNDMETRTAPQEFTPGDDFFYLTFSGHGEIGAYVPADYDAYVSGEKIVVDPQTHRGIAKVSGEKVPASGLGYHIELTPDGSPKNPPPKRPAELIAFKRSDQPLEGSWPKLRWHGSIDNAKYITGNDRNGYRSGVGSIGRIIGKVPQAKSVRAKGAYQMIEGGTGFPGDGVIRINGKEIARFPYGEKPYPITPFDIDLSPYMGQYIMLEFKVDGSVRGPAADWIEPRFEVEK
jgi:hypothetical protein